MRVTNESLFQVGTTSADLSTNWTSKPIYVGHIMDVAVQLAWTGSPTGTFSLQVSCDPESSGHGGADQAALATHWTTLASPTLAATGVSNGVMQLSDLGYSWIRVSYAAGGTGTLTAARCNGKGL